MITFEMQGDVIEAFKEGKYDGLVHGCNCFCNFGAGIAKSILKEFPIAFKADKGTIKGDRNKLGNYSMSITEHGIIINAYTQYHYGFGKMNCDYTAIKKVFERLNEEYKGQIFCIPKIGCGLAKGDWNVVEKIINEATPDVGIDVYCL